MSECERLKRRVGIDVPSRTWRSNALSGSSRLSKEQEVTQSLWRASLRLTHHHDGSGLMEPSPAAGVIQESTSPHPGANVDAA